MGESVIYKRDSIESSLSHFCLGTVIDLIVKHKVHILSNILECIAGHDPLGWIHNPTMES